MFYFTSSLVFNQLINFIDVIYQDRVLIYSVCKNEFESERSRQKLVYLIIQTNNFGNFLQLINHLIVQTIQVFTLVINCPTKKAYCLSE